MYKIRGTYVSGEESERGAAFELGYRTVCQHPNEIGLVTTDETLVIDFDNVLFNDRDQAVMVANEAANRGVTVGIHTYYPDDPRLGRFMALPNVFVAKTHEDVLAAIHQQATANGARRAIAANYQTDWEKTDVHEHTSQNGAGHSAAALVVAGASD